MKSNHNLIWIDLEMTGLNPNQERIIEIATIVTDSNLVVLAEGPVLAIHQADSLLERMDAWNTRQHHQSGLVDRVKASTVDEQEAERLTLEFLRQWIDSGKSPMCGNSICHDKRFLNQYMPDLAAYFHYRLIDVSTLKELVSRWQPHLLSGLNKKSKHMALEDVKDSIAELAYYRQHFIRNQDDRA